MPLDPWEIAIAVEGAVPALALIRDRWNSRAKKFGDGVESGSGLSRGELAERLQDDPRLEEIFVSAYESAIRSASEQRLVLLTRAVAKGLLSETNTQVDEAYFFTRTLLELEVPHLIMLQLIVEKQGMAMRGPMRLNELRDAYSRGADSG